MNMKKNLQKLGFNVACGRLEGYEKIFIGGCGKWVDILQAYRCTDCTAPFHRKCAQKHFLYPLGKKPPKKT